MRDYSKISGRTDRRYPMSNTEAARKAIRDHMLSYYEDRGGFEGMKREADNARGGAYSDQPEPNDWQKGKYLAQAGRFAWNNPDAKDFLKQIYVSEDVEKWDEDKAWDRYTDLIGREYARMAEAKRKGK